MFLNKVSIPVPIMCNKLEIKLTWGQKCWIFLFQAEAVGVDGNGIDKVAGNLLYTIAAKLKTQILHHRNLLAKYVGQKKITSEPQLTGDLTFIVFWTISLFFIEHFQV